MRLTVKIYKGEKYYIARVPELGVTTQGKTREEAKKNLKEAVQLHLESVVDYMITESSLKNFWLNKEDNVWNEYLKEIRNDKI